MDAIQVPARLTIHEGRLEEKRSRLSAMRSVRERTRARYTAIGSSTMPRRNASFETCKDSGAVLEHITNLGATLGAILSRRACLNSRNTFSAQDLVRVNFVPI